MNDETKNVDIASPNNQVQATSPLSGSVNGTPFTATNQKPLTQEKPKQVSKLISASLIMVVSGFVSLIGIAMFLFSDVRHAQDYLLPVAMILQLIFAIALFSGKRWGLIGYTVILFALFVTIFIYYTDKPAVAQRTVIGISPLLLPLSYLWIRKRKYFN